MKFLVDAHLPRELCQALEQAGHDARHTTQLPQGNRTSDQEINRISVAEDRVVVTKDSDFFFSRLVSKHPWKLLLVRTGNLGGDELVAVVVRHLADIVSALETSDLVELDRQQVRTTSP